MIIIDNEFISCIISEITLNNISYSIDCIDNASKMLVYTKNQIRLINIDKNLLYDIIENYMSYKQLLDTKNNLN